MTVTFMVILVPESLLDLSEANLARETQVFVILARRQLGHRGDSLPAGIASPDSVLLHMPMVARRGSYPRV